MAKKTNKNSHAGGAAATAAPPAAQRPAKADAALEPKTTARPSAERPDPTHEEIAYAAYVRWTTHGGDPETNWFEAERELRARREISL